MACCVFVGAEEGSGGDGGMNERLFLSLRNERVGKWDCRRLGRRWGGRGDSKRPGAASSVQDARAALVQEAWAD